MTDSNIHSSTTIKRACTNCREQKVRCDVVEEPPTPCSRCRRLKLDCALAPLKRKLRNSIPNGDESTLRPLRPVLPTSDLHSVSAASRKANGAHSDDQNGSKDVSDHPTRLSVSANPAVGTSSLWIGHGRPAPRSLDGFTLEGHTIQNLHDIYFSVYDPTVPFLDPTRSPDYYYAAEPLLFWAIMTVASRRYLKELNLLHELAPRTTKLASTSVAGPPASVHVVESLLVLLTWWYPNQASMQEIPFALAGSLLHLAMQLGLHRPMKSQDYSRIKLSLTHQDLIRRTELWTRTVLLYQKYCVVNGAFFFSTLTHHTNSLWSKLPSDLRYFSMMQHSLAQYLMPLSEESQRFDDGATSSNIEPLIKIADAHFLDKSSVAPEPGPNNSFSWTRDLHFQICRLCIYSYHLHFPHLKTPTPTTLELYSISCNVLTTIENLQSAMANYVTATSTYLFQTSSIAAFTVLKLLKTPSFASTVDVSTGESLLFSTIRFMAFLSLADNDLAAKSSKLLRQLWRSEKVFRDPTTGNVNLGLRIRSRGCMSIVYDCAWWWREEFGGQPNTYTDNNTVTTLAANLASNEVATVPAGSKPTPTARQASDSTPPTTSVFPPASCSMTKGEPAAALSTTSTLSDLTYPSQAYDNMALGGQMLADLGWDAFDDFLFLSEGPPPLADVPDPQ